MIERPDTTPVILLLAAGESRRFGGIKQLADINGEPMVRRVARTVLATGAKVIVVTGAHADKVSAALADLPLLVMHNPAWSKGMGCSLAIGIRQVHDHFPFAAGALLCLADQPLLDSSSLSDMLDRHAEMPTRILVTEHMGIAAPPVLFPSDCFAELRHLSGKQGAQALIKREMHRVESFASNVVFDVDTEMDLVRVRNLLAAVGEK